MLNATAAAALAHCHGISAETIAWALRGFLSVKRRLEVRAEVGGITVIDDFAHHPTAIGATLGALRKRYAGRRLWAILEPRSNTLRRNVFQQRTGGEPGPGGPGGRRQRLLQGHGCVEAGRAAGRGARGGELNARGVAAQQLPDVEAIVADVAAQAAAGDVLAILSNGGFGGIYEKLPAALEARASCGR